MQLTRLLIAITSLLHLSTAKPFIILALAHQADSSASSWSPSTSKTTPTPTPTPLCSYSTPTGLIQPKADTTIHINPEGPTEVEVVYCSGQYFKTYSISGDVWLNDAGSDSGEIVSLQVQPDNKDAQPGFYSYRFNVSLYPLDGEAPIGKKQLSFYEVASGYYNSYNYFVSRVDVHLVAKQTEPGPATYSVPASLEM